MEHGDCRRGRSMTVGRPCVEREQCAEHTEADEYKGKEDVLCVLGHGMHTCQLSDIHCGGTAEIVDAEYAEYQKG